MDETSSRIHQEQQNRVALNKKIEFYRHNINEVDKAELLKVLDSIFISTGDVVTQFEQKFATYMGSRYAVGVMSCTHALELALRVYGIGHGDEVITTPLSFVATSNAIEYVGAKPVFVDVEEHTGNINADFIEQAITPKTKALIVVHLYGQMCDMKKIRAIADKRGLKVIEDCAHCIEGMRDGVRPGQLGDVACYSFYATKNLTCGEGGALTCNDQATYEWLMRARQHGITKSAASRYTKKYEHYDMEFLGLKCNMNNMQAALMLHQLDRLDGYWARRQEIAESYDRYLEDVGSLTLLTTVPHSRHARHLYTIHVAVKRRDIVMHALQDEGIGIAVNYRPIHLMKYYRDRYGYEQGSFPVAEDIGSRTITIPLYSSLTDDQVDYIARSVVKCAA